MMFVYQVMLLGGTATIIGNASVGGTLTVGGKAEFDGAVCIW